MAADHSAGIVLYRAAGRVDAGAGRTEILLVHPGGPFWAGKDEHAWSIPKGEFDPDAEPAFEAARREFREELGVDVPDGEAVALPSFRAGRKRISAFLLAGEIDASTVRSNEFEMEWPPRSGRMQSFPEIDAAAWFDIETARTKLHKGQVPLCDLVETALA